MAASLRLTTRGVTAAVTAGRSGTQVASRGSQRRQFWEGLLNTKNNLAENHIKFTQNPHLHGADNPTFLKKGMEDQVIFGVGSFMVGYGLLSTFYGLYHMSNGTNKLEVV